MRIVAAVSLAAALALPAAAAAHPTVSPSSVSTHLGNADRAITRVVTLVRAHRDAAAVVAFARNRAQMRRARSEARTLAGRDPLAGATALAALAAQQDRAAEVLSVLIAQAGQTMQVPVAKAAAGSFKSRGETAATLTGLAGELPVATQQTIASALALLFADDKADAQTLAGAVGDGTVTDLAKPWIEFAIAQMTAGLQTATSALGTLVPLLPAVAQPQVQAALDQVGAVLTQVTGLLRGLFGAAPVSGAAPAGATTSGLLLPFKLPLLSGLPLPFLH